MATVIDDQAAAQAASGRTQAARQFTVAEYYRMLEAGILDEDERVELIEGEIVNMAAKSIQHTAAVRRTSKCLSRLLAGRAFIAAQDPIHLDDYSEPEPDVIVASPSPTEYEDHHPTPAELFLVVEVAETSYGRDRNRKLLLYAQAGIAQYWILNSRDRELEDYRDPGPHGYRSKQTYTEEQVVSLVAFPDVNIGVAELLPRK
jgi:Uma2 family endonuclease